MNIDTATAADADVLFALINDAYEVETGDSGVAFKHTRRMLSLEGELSPLLAAGRMLIARSGAAGQIVGCLYFHPEVDPVDGQLDVHFGPFCVAPSVKGQGIGRLLLAALDAQAARLRARGLLIEVVNTRDDLFPMYERLGYVRIGTAPFPVPERCTRPVHFVVMRRTL